jgi:DNA-binding transcriptional regulator YhcF (GntR family)
MVRIKFPNNVDQRIFLEEVMAKTNCPSIRELANRVEINYASLKSYFSLRRLLSKEIFDRLVTFAEIDLKKFKFTLIEENWGQVKGGKKSKKN